MRGHDDEAQDKKVFNKMLKKAMPAKKVSSHLKKDMKEEKKAYGEDKKLMKSMHKGMKSCGR
jgi:hypothetical protein